MSEPVIVDEESARSYCAKWTDQGGMERLDRFAAALLAENRNQNLISRKSEESLWLRHMADSAQLLRFVSRETSQHLPNPISEPWLDLGTGAGFPGLVIAALRPEMPVYLVESRARRVEFLARMAHELVLPNCTVLGERLEAIDPFAVGVISARAFAPLDKLLRLSAAFSTSATTYLLPKGRSAAQEWENLPRRQRQLFHVEQSLTDEEAGIIVGGVN